MAGSSEVSYDTKTIVVVLLLVFFYPIGVILAWVWMRWPKWVKLLVTLPLVLLILGLIFSMILAAALFKNLPVEKSNYQIQISTPSAESEKVD